MKTGTAIARTVRPFVNIADTILHTNLGNCRGCRQMEQDFNHAEYLRDYTNAVMDRIRKRGKYKQPTT